RKHPTTQPEAVSPIEATKAVPIILTRSPALPILDEQVDTPFEQQLGVWLALEACQLGQLLNAGWTPQAILDSLRVVLQGVQGMPRITRRKLLELGTAAMVSSIPILTEKHVTAEERMQLAEALGKSI